MSSLLLPIDLSVEARFKWPPLPKAPFYFFLDMGLFDRLPFSIENEQQFNSLALGLKYFSETLLLQSKELCKGVVFYRGPLIQEPEKRRFLNDLLSILPPDIRAQLWFDREKHSLSQAIQWASLEYFPHFDIKVDEHFVFHQNPLVDIALLLPPASSEEAWKEIDTLLEAYPHSRLIPEAHLTHMWDGLNTLVCLERGYSVQGERKIAGFIAAGGSLIYVKTSPLLGGGVQIN